MLLFTVIAVVLYAFSIWMVFQAIGINNEGGFTTFPNFDKTILTLIGISHVGYLTYKATPHRESDIGANKQVASPAADGGA